MGVTRRAADLPTFLEAVGEPETAAEIRRIRRATALGQEQPALAPPPAPEQSSFQHRAPRRLARRPAATYSTQVGDDSEDDDDSEHGEATTDSGSSSSDSASSSDEEEEEGSAAEGPPMADGKRAPGTDDERAERLARMMAAQCTLEPPEKVGLKTGWRPSASGFGVTAVGSSPGGGAAGLGAWTPPSTPGTPGADAQAPSPGGIAGVASPAASFTFRSGVGGSGSGSGAAGVSSPAAPFTFRVGGSGSGSGAAGVASPAAPFTFRFDAQPAPAPEPAPEPEPEPEPEPPTSPRQVLAQDVPSVLRQAQRAYVAVAASSAGVDGAEVPRGGREVRSHTGFVTLAVTLVDQRTSRCTGATSSCR